MNLIVTPISTSQMRLDWTDVAANEDHYLVFRSLDGSLYTQIAILPPNTTSYNDIGLQPSTPYFYQVTAINRGGSNSPPPDGNVTFDLLWGFPPATGGPGARGHHSAIYDSVGQRMIVFGGADPGLKGDLWQLDLTNPTLTTGDWSTLTTTAAPGPGPRTGHSAIYDSVNNRMIVFGGQQTGPPTSAYLNEVWVLSLTGTPAWSQITPTGTLPEPRRSHTAVYDPVRREMIVHGGFDDTGIPFSNFYVLSLPANTAQFVWTRPFLSTFDPGLRQWHASIHDPLGPRMVMFGGIDDDAFLDGTSTNGETWTLTPGVYYSWNKLSFSATPPPREGHTAIYDSLNQRMMIFGGGDALLDPLTPPDLWAMTLGSQPSWSLLSPSGPLPTKRHHHTAVYDSLNNRMVVYGGEIANATYTDEVWWISP